MRPALPLALAACLLPGTAPAQPAAPQPWRNVAIYRGAEANVPPAIPIHRGSSAMGTTPAQATRQAPQPASAGPTAAVAGSRLWLVDPASGELVACRIGGTTQVGVDRVRCTAGELP